MGHAITTTNPGTLAEVAASWGDLTSQERKVRATKAASEYDALELDSLLAAVTYTHGSRGARVSPATLSSYQRDASELVTWARAQGVPLLHLSGDHAARWLRFLEETLSPATVRGKLAAVRSLWRSLRWAGATSADPWADVRAGRDSSPSWAKRLPYTAAEIERLLGIASPLEAVLVLLGAHAGLRISEAVRVTWSDVAGDLVRVVGKGGRADVVPVSGSLRDALDALRSTIGTVSEDSPVLGVSVTGARRRLAKLCRWLGIANEGTTNRPGRSFHALRHSLGSRIVAEGASTVLAARVLRHSSVSTTERYTHINTQAQAGSWLASW